MIDYAFKGMLPRVMLTLFDGLNRRGKDRSLHFPAWAEPLNVLFVNLAGLGDVLSSLPAIRAFKYNFPEARITLLVAPRQATLFQADQDIAETITYKVPWWEVWQPGTKLRRYLQTAWQCLHSPLATLLSGQRFDLAVNFQSYLPENLALAKAGIPRRIGWEVRGGRRYLTDIVEYRETEYIVERNLRLVQAIEPQRKWGLSGVKRPLIHLSEESRAKTHHFLSSRKLDGRPLIAIHPLAAYPSKRWPKVRFQTLARKLVDEFQTTIVWIGSAGEQEFIEDCVEAIPERSVSLAGKLDLLGLAAVLGETRLCIGNDSGPVRLAAAMGVPTITIFSGEFQPHQWIPWGAPAQILHYAPPCANCNKARCDRGHICMEKITVEDVLEKVVTFVREGVVHF